MAIFSWSSTTSQRCGERTRSRRVRFAIGVVGAKILLAASLVSTAGAWSPGVRSGILPSSVVQRTAAIRTLTPSPTAAPSSTRSGNSKTALYDVSSVPKDDGSGVSYSERSRPYRRDVFQYDDWVRHRSSERFTGRLRKLTQSGIARALTDEVVLLAAVATFVCAFNALLVTGYEDFANGHHAPLVAGLDFLPALSLPAMFFTLSSPALSLLLGTYVCLSCFLCVFSGTVRDFEDFTRKSKP